MSDLTRRFLVVGLGNPGKKYEDTRHNAGFKVVSILAKELSQHSWTTNREYNAGILKVTLNLPPSSTSEGPKIQESSAVELILLKPLTFMNRSGESVGKVAKFFKIAAENIIVVHDEIDLPFGTIRIKLGGGSGGHNGLRSLGESLGTGNFLRVRFGVGRPEGLTHQKSGESESSDLNIDGRQLQKARHSEVSDWVLTEFLPEEQRELPCMLARAAQAVIELLRNGLQTAQRLYN